MRLLRFRQALFSQHLSYIEALSYKLILLQMLCHVLPDDDILLSTVSKERLLKLLKHLLDEETFLSAFGVRSLSKVNVLATQY